MYMWLLNWIPWFVFSGILESSGQVCFKKAALAARHLSDYAYYKGLARQSYLYLGILFYLGEMAVWLYIISNIPLSIAFPLSGLQEMLIVLFAAMALKEKIAPLAWLGIAFIALGVSLVA